MANQDINWDQVSESDKKRFCEDLQIVSPFKLPITPTHTDWYMVSNRAIYILKQHIRKWYWLIDIRDYWIKSRLLIQVESYNPRTFYW
jgi:hypothetical protein